MGVVGDPFLVVGEEKIKFFLPPGEMVELVSWASPSGKPVSLRGSTFQQKGSKKGAWHKNVQWFRRFELTLANETALEITSLHKSYIEVKLDGKEVAVGGSKAKPVTLYSELAKEIGLVVEQGGQVLAPEHAGEVRAPELRHAGAVPAAC